jgi:hypothetical protein
MVHHISNVIKEYQDKLREMPHVPKISYHRDSLGYCGDENETIFTFLFCNRDIGNQFMKDAGLIRSKVQCNSCGRDMTWYAEPSVPDGFKWRCRRMVRGNRCFWSRSSCPALGSIGVNSPSRRFWTSHKTSCAAKLPTTSNTNITSVNKPSRTGVCSADKQC